MCRAKTPPPSRLCYPSWFGLLVLETFLSLLTKFGLLLDIWDEEKVRLVVGILVRIMNYDDEQVQIAALRAVSNLAVQPDDLTKMLLDLLSNDVSSLL